MKSIHLICKRTGSGSLAKLSHDKATGLYRSGHWDMGSEQAEAVRGGWLYLHETKASPSVFGGIVVDFEKVHREELAHRDRIVFLLRSDLHGKGQTWRGASHGMAHSGGLVDADLPHERAPD